MSVRLYGATGLGSQTHPIRACTNSLQSKSMATRIACRIENVTVRASQRETVDDLIYKMFERRHHSYVAGQEKDWLTVELVQSLRRESEVYREELSTETAGPLPFAVGYFQRQGEHLVLTTDQIPANVSPKALVRFLSEFVDPGARFWFETGDDREGWEVQGVDDLVPLDAPANAA